MRKLVTLGSVAILAFGFTGTASAAVLHYDGRLTIELGTLPPIDFSGLGVATVNNSGALGHLGNFRLKSSRGGIGGKNKFVPVTDAAAAPIVGILVTASVGTGTLGPISGGVQTSVLTSNVLPVRGLAKVCLFSTACGTALPLLLTQHTGATGTKGFGIGGILTIGGTSPIRISIEAAPWTIQTKTVIDQITTPVGGTAKKFIQATQMGGAGDSHTPFSETVTVVHMPSSTHVWHEPTSETHDDFPDLATSNTAGPGGVVQLITPMQVVTNLTNGSNAKIALFGVLTIRFVPEPAMLLLLGSGILGLVLLGRYRMRK